MIDLVFFWGGGEGEGQVFLDKRTVIFTWTYYDTFFATNPEKLVYSKIYYNIHTFF